MYRQVLVCPTDAARQKILWRETSNEPMIPYLLNTVTHGTSPAPFLALRTLIQLAIDEGSQYPRAAEALRKETYLMYSFQEPTQVDEITKRGMLSLVAKLYDPMGWLAPVLVIGKIMIQRLWVTEKDWDAPIDGPMKEQWNKFREQLGCLRTVRIPRWLGLIGSSRLWWKGPSWLILSRDQWSKISGRSEIRTALSVGLVNQVPFLVALGERFSSITTYNRVVAWILRFISNCRRGKVQSPLNPAEIKRAHVEILLAVQQHYFGEGLKSLSRH
ncbi:hypothetical protein LAZ67_2003311 [Cordylochernes scorpioides]|uniref:Uncharacterized protein n=1 Tax=Cordylochernes scorpioides TaxID=51811 RepID=A0ABY6K3H3_9ARAC|nr:hypothetical protein LAZ67_2003311 [Cordylochernes scorpioides]